MYYAPGATHAPHHVPREWADKYRGQFDQGWDRLREETFARQKQLGVVPQECELTERSPGLPAWDDMPGELKPVLARQMEIYAGFLENTDHQVGKLLDTLAALGILDDTLIYVIIGDNGASAEGSLQGTFNEMIPLTGFAQFETTEFMVSKIEQFGGPEAYNHYAVSWGHAMNTPFQWTKQVASHFGGTRNGAIVHWPRGFKARGEIRSQFCHLIDVAPTVLEAAGLPAPLFVNGVQQKPLEGVSMAYSFDNAAAPERHETQYFEMMGNRGIYHKGWTAVTKHRTPWELGAAKLPAFDEDVWELYDTRADFSQAHNLAAKHPERLHELQRLWLIEAVKYNVVPMDDRAAERIDPHAAGRPTLIRGHRQLLFSGMSRLSENSIVHTNNKSHAVTAEVEIPAAGAEGVIIAMGGMSGGWSLYVKGGKPKYCYNFYGLEESIIEGAEAIPPGVHQVRMEFAYDGGGLAKGATITLYLDGREVGVGRVERTEPMGFSADETCDVGNEYGSPVTKDYGRRKFSGEVSWVQIDIGVEDSDHMISPEERLKVAMAWQ